MNGTMSTTTGPGLTGSQAPVCGRIAGAVLGAIRSHVGLTQQGLAETMQVSLATVQGWESGRRPLINLKMATAAKLRRVLQLSTVSSMHLAALDDAFTADGILAEISADEPGLHPLALVVPNRQLTDLLAWPFTGRPPRQIADTRASLDIGAGERDSLAALLREVADRTNSDLAGAMLRRQVQFLLTEHRPSTEWLTAAAHRERAFSDLREWSPTWVVARSQAISASVLGDQEPLERFIHDGLASERAQQAQLRYWAYWVGELPYSWTSDADMLTDSQPWSGETLLVSLLNGLENAPYRDLCAHALHSLVPSRRSLDTPPIRQRILDAIDRATAGQQFNSDSIRKLDQLSYALRSKS